MGSGSTKSGGGPARAGGEEEGCRSGSRRDPSWVAWLAHHDLHPPCAHRPTDGTGRAGQNRVRLRSNPAAHEPSADRRCMHCTAPHRSASHRTVQRRLAADPLCCPRRASRGQSRLLCPASSPARCRRQDRHAPRPSARSFRGNTLCCTGCWRARRRSFRGLHGRTIRLRRSPLGAPRLSCRWGGQSLECCVQPGRCQWPVCAKLLASTHA